MSHEKTSVYPSEEEQTYRIPNQENGLGTHDNLIGRLKEGEYDPKQEYQLIDTEGTQFRATLTGLAELNEHRTFDTGNMTAHDRLVQIEITERQKLDNDGTVYNARGRKWVRLGNLIDQMHVNFEQDERERRSNPAELGLAALRIVALDEKRNESKSVRAAVGQHAADDRISA